MAENPPSPAWKNQGPSPAKKESASVPAWKKDAAAPDAAGPRAWQDQPGTPAVAPRPRSKYTRLLFAVGLLSALISGIVLWIIYYRPLKPATLIVLGASYDVNLALPHNAYGWKGMQELKDTSGMRLAYSPQEEVGDHNSWKKLWGAAPKEFGEKTVIVYLALHGGVDGKGPFFFLNDPRGQDRLYFHDFLKDLKTRWPSKNVLLILEPAQVAFHRSEERRVGKECRL